MKKLFKLIFALSVSSLCSFGNPGMAADLQVDRDYKLVSPPLETAKGKIEVIEFFSYGCPHCKEFSPFVEKWSAGLPRDVSFRRVPITFNKPEWARLAKLFYALETTGHLARLDAEVFKAIHDERIALYKSDESIMAWATSKGIDARKLGEAMSSFSMQSRVQRGDQDAATIRIPGVPAILVDGKYLINNDVTDGKGGLLKLTDAVITKARQDHKSK